MATKKGRVVGKPKANLPTKRKTSVISRPPPGYYDPALDAQERAAGRGLEDLVLDTDTAGGRSTTDFILGQEDLKRQRGELGEDIATARTGVETNYGRSLSDLLTQRTQTGEDYTRNLAQLQRNYDILGSRQSQTARAAGVSAGGAGAQAARKRAANQAWERQPIDTGYQRFGQASAESEQRLGQDKSTALADLLTQEKRGLGALDRAGGQLNLGYQRGGEDLATQLARAQRENLFYGSDIGEARFQQATQLGWSPPQIKAAKATQPKVVSSKPQTNKRRRKVGTVTGSRRGLGGI